MTKNNRLTQGGELRVKAPIAALFEDCCQAFQQLAAALEVNGANSALHRISKDGTFRLKTWGLESGASSRSYDYAIRGSPLVKKQTQSLLEDLHDAVEEVISGVLPEIAGLGEPEITIPDNEKDTAKSADNDSEPGNQLHDEEWLDTDVNHSVRSLLEEAIEIIGHLNQLLPALRNLPQDFEGLTVINEADKYFEDGFRRLAATMFPTAPKSVQKRLGRSNWRRRHNIWGASVPVAASHGQNRFLNTAKSFFAPWERQLRRMEARYRNDSEQHLSTRGGSEVESSTIVSHAETVLTKVPIRDSVTSTTDSSYPPPVLQFLNLPEPPVELGKSGQFECPYCRFELPLVFSAEPMGMDQWKTHVFDDLKPYQCTFEDCFYEHRLYSNRRQWFEHELNEHRSRLIWFCGLCISEFSDAASFKAHIECHHAALSAQEKDILLRNCQGYCQDPQVRLSCNLCGHLCGNVYELEDHLAKHLETFALAALSREDISEEEEIEGGGMMDIYFEQLPAPQAHGNSTAPANEMADSDSDDETVDEARQHFATPGVSGDAEDTGKNLTQPPSGDWKERVQNFVTKQIVQSPDQVIRHNVPPRFENFVGRDDDLYSLHKHLSKPGQICIVSGRGGVGKTAIAIEYLYKYESTYSHIFWVEAETAGLCADRYGSISTVLGLDQKPLADEEARTYTVKAALKDFEQRWLLIFDNVASWSNVEKYVPQGFQRTEGSILITTRTNPPFTIPLWNPLSAQQHPVRMDAWSLEHSREFLLTSIDPKLKRENLLEHDEYHLAEPVVEVVGRLPLAVSMIVGYLKVSRCTLADFREMWEEKEVIDRKKKHYKLDFGAIDIDDTINSLWTIGMREVRMNSRRLLDIVAFLDPDNIQEKLLFQEHKEPYLEFLNPSEALSYKRMITELSGRHLIAIKKNSKGETIYTIHRVLQKKLLLDMEEYTFANAFRKAFRLIRKPFPITNAQQIPKPQAWEACAEYIPHVATFCRIYTQSASVVSLTEPKPLELAQLFYDAGFYVYSRQTTAYDGISFLETAEKILDAMQEDAHAKIRADIYALTGVLLLDMGCYERAKALGRLKRAWEIRKIRYKRERNHINDVLLQNASNDYSLGLLNERDFNEAGRLMTMCYEHYQAWGTEADNPFEYSKYYGNFSTVLMWRGETEKAIEYQRRAMHLTEKFSGRKGSYYRRKYLLGCMLLQAGDIQGALDTHLEVLAARLELHGKHHDYTISSTYAVGAMYHHQGELMNATEYINHCIECVKVSKWDRAAYARAKYHLAVLYRQQGIKPERADLLEENADDVLDELRPYAAECVRGVEDKMMILDDLQPSFMGRYTGVKLLKHLQKHLGSPACK